MYAFYLVSVQSNRNYTMITIQNPYSLLNRIFEGDLAEVCVRENVGLLAYSPLAFGVLSGKYINGTASESARLNKFPRFARYSSQESTTATKNYMEIAQKFNLSLTQMALAFVNQQPFVRGNIIGATNISQLKENIDSVNIHLNDEVLEAINKVHSQIPNPAP